MEPAAIYLTSHDTAPLSRETLIYDNAELALARLARLDRHLIAREDNASGRSPPGLADMISPDPVIAMGMLPHRRLADFQKRSLLAGELALDDAASSAEDIAQLIWSCANTSRVIALGEAAWRMVQMLPVEDRRHYPVPPLKLPQALEVKARRLFVINHGADDRPVHELAKRAQAEGFGVVCSGIPENPGQRRYLDTQPFCCPEAAIHIHLGHHNAAAKSFRLIDSWHSGRLAVQWIKPAQEAADAENLLVEDATNGFICHSIEAVLAACGELAEDHVLCHKFAGAGHRTAEPPARAWSAIAAELLR
jgi:hypothetical protein